MSANQTTVDGVEISGRDLHAVYAILHKEIFTGVTCSAAGVLKSLPMVNWKDMGETIPVDRNTFGIPPRTTTHVWTGTGTSVPPISTGRQNIDGPRQSIITEEVRNNNPLNNSINIIPAKHRDPKPSWSKVIGSKKITNEGADIYARGRTNFRSDTVLSESPNFMDFRLPSVNTTDELGSIFSPTTRIGRPADGSNWFPPGRDISEATADRVSETKAKNHYNLKGKFETR